MEDTLSVGDIVCLYSAESYGFVFSTQSSSVHNELAVGSKQDRVRPDIQDQHVFAFQIQVANRYKLNKQYTKSKQKLYEDPENLTLRSSVTKAKISAESENDDNDLEQKRQQGKKVLYGQVIQLRHLFSNKYVHVSTTKTSDTESNNMAVELDEANAKHCQFKIMPRYKVKAEGDVVQVDDQIVLESVKSPGSFLHVSNGVFPVTSTYSKCHELNLSVQQSGFTIYRKYKPSPDDENKVKVGDIIRFYHKEMEAYLVAEGLFDNELVEDVHLRIRQMDQAIPKTLFPSSSAITYWQIELYEGPTRGGIFKWEQQCKIIHMCTRKYLTVNSDGNVTLTSNHVDPRTVFRLHPVIREIDDIAIESYCRIEHVVTGHWLHACADEYKRKVTVNADDTKSMNSLKWSTAQLRQKKKRKKLSNLKINVGTIEEKQYDDAFTIQGVEEDLLHVFNYMAGMVPFIQKLVVIKKSNININAKMAHETIIALQEIKAYMIHNSEPSKQRQKLMRNLRIVDILVNLLQIPFRGSPDQYHLTRIFVEAYDVLYTYLMGDSRKNELYIAKYIDFFLSQFEYKEGMIGLNAAHMVMELIRDNRKIVDRISNEHIDKFIELLRREKNHRYLDLLKVLCVCDGVSIADNQKYITEVWLMKGNRNCVFYTDLGQKIGKEHGVVYVSTNQGRSWTELAEFAQDDKSEAYLFLEHQLELFGEVCHGQNEFSIKVITQELNYLTWEEAFTCLSDSRLPDKLRSQYCDLITTLFVDISDNHSVIDRVKLSYIYDDIDEFEIHIADHFSSISDHEADSKASEILQDLKRMKETKHRPVTAKSLRKKRTMSLASVNMSLRHTTQDQSMDTKDMSFSKTYQYFPTLRDWISTFLTSNGDMVASQVGNNMLVQQVLRLVESLVSFGFYHKADDILALLEPLMSLIDGRNDKPFPNVSGKEGEEILKYFRKKERYLPSVETKAVVDAKVQALEVLNLFFNLIFNLRLERFMYLFKVTHTQANRPGAAPPELGPLLYEAFDLAKSSGTVDNHTVSKAAMRKLNMIFDKTAFLKDYDLVNVLKDLSFYQYDEMIRMSMHLLNRYFSAYSQLFDQAVQAQVLITEKSTDVYNTLEKLIPRLRRMSSAKMSDAETEELVKILDQLISMCHLEGEYEEAHGMNQSILYNYGVLDDMFIILSQDIDVKLLDKYSGQRKVFQRTFTVLKLLARSNKIVQGRLFDRLDMLLTKEGAYAELAECLTEVFTGNSSTCMKINGNQVQKIMALVAKHKESVPQFLDLLNAVVKVEELDLPLKRNQGFVMQYFMQFRKEVAHVIDREEAQREQILVEPNNKELEYLIAVVDLLATCAEGENRFIESICQTIFKIPEILRILTNARINDNLKRPFLRFFVWVYLNTAGGMIESGAGDLPHDKMMWDYIIGITVSLNAVTEYAKTESKTIKTLLKRPPTKGDRGNTKEEIMRGSIHYLFESCMPFLLIFCRTYYQPDASLFPEEPRHMDELAKSFKSFMEVMAPLISMEKQMKNLVSCMTTLLSASTLPVTYIEDFQEKFGGGVGGQDVRSDARKIYEEYYEMEMDINVKLNVYAVNMKVAYGGLNTVEAQIGYDSDAVYTEVGQDEDLPLGNEFQEHLKFFIDHGKKDPRKRLHMCEKLVKQLMISAHLTTHLTEREKLEQVELDIKCLKLLRGLIHNEIVKLPEDWENEANEHRRQLRVIEDVQDALDRYGVVISVLEHLNRPQDAIVRETLSFLAILLFNGNAEVQNSLIGYFTGTREETFFFAIKARMQMSAVATREKRLLNAMHQAKIDEAVQQARALKKAMQTGKMAANDKLQASRLGSMLSLARQSMTNLRGSMSRLSGSPRFNKQNTLLGSRLLNTPTMNGIPSKKTSQNGLNGFASQAKVAPMDDPDVKIESVDDDELQELMEAAMAMSDDLEFKDDGYIELVLRILGLMCDNQHFDIQNYLREQPDNIKSVNLVAETTKFLNILYSNINDKSMPLVVQLFDTLVEFTSGNQLNQAVVFDNKICDYINHILRVGQFKGCDQKDVYVLKKSIATLIRSLTEENPPEKEEDAIGAKKEADLEEPSPCEEVMEYLDADLCMATMTEAYHHLQKSPGESEELELLISETGFGFYHILCRKMDIDPVVKLNSLLKTPEQKLAWDYFNAGTLSIEIIKNDVLQKIYFRVKDKKVLRDEIKEKFKYEVNRTSPSNKIRDFMDWASDIMHDIKYQQKVYANPVGRLLVKLWLPMNYIVVFLSFFMSILIMITWRDPEFDDGTSRTGVAKPEYSIGETYTVLLYICGGLHNVFSLLVLVTFFVSNKPTFPPLTYLQSLLMGEDEDAQFKAWHEKKTSSHLEIHIYSFKTIYYFAFLACSILGTVFYGYFFAFHLLHIAELNQLLKRVIQAVTTNGNSLMMVALLGLAIFYSYSLIAFAFLRESYFKEDSGRHCRTVYQCFVTMIHHGFVDSPYTTIEGEMNDDYTEVLVVTAFDVTFFILVTTIGLNIIFGIIVDTFSQLRDSKWEIDKDMQNNCFICSRESYDFERHGGGFAKHVREEHNQWAYLFFFIHLDQTRPNDYTALELHVFELLQSRRFDFFPLNRALSLLNEEDTNEKKLDAIRTNIEYLVTKMKEEEAAREREKEKQRQLAWEAQHKPDGKRSIGSLSYS